MAVQGSGESIAAKLGRLLVRLREERGWNQREFAKRLGMPPATASAWETGKSMPQGESLRKIAEVFDLTVGEMFATAGIETSAPVVTREIPLFSYDRLRHADDGVPTGGHTTTIDRSPRNTDSRAYAFCATGQEMYPRVWQGDVVELQTTGAEPGDLVLIIRVGSGDKRLCRIQSRRRGSVTVIPLQPFAEPEELASEGIVIHKVVAIRPGGRQPAAPS